MKKTKTIIITFIVALLAGSVFAQQNASPEFSPGISKNYPALVIQELKQVLEKIPLNTQKQEAMANYLLKKGNRLKEIANQSPEQQIALKDSLQRVFVSILGNQDLKTYYEVIVRNKGISDESLEHDRLTPTDKSTLKAMVLEREIQLTMLKDAENDIEKFEKLKAGITDSYRRDIDKFLLSKGYTQTPYEKWAEGVLQTYVTKYQLNDKEKDALRPLIVKKYRELSTIKLKSIAQATKDSEVNAIEEQAGKDLDKFLAFNHKAPKGSKLLQLVSRKEELQLSNSQIDIFIDFIANSRKKGLVKSENNGEVISADGIIVKTLSKEQYLKYLSFTNKSYETWAEDVLQTYVTKYQLNAKEKDALRPLIVKKYRELSTIKLKSIAQTTKDSAVNAINEEAGKDLDRFLALNKKAPKNSKLLQIVSKKSDFQLSEFQTESFLDFLALTRKNGLVKESNKGGIVSTDVFIAKTLNKEQYLKYLALANKDKASEKAKSDWRDAQKLGLTSGLDSASTLKVLTDYYTSIMISQQRKDLKPEEQESEAIQLKGAIPLLITKLKTARKKPNTEMALKKGFTW